MKLESRTVVTLLLAVTAACSSGGGGLGLPDLSDILGSSSSDDRSDVRGRVVTIDTYARRIDLDVDYVNNLREERRGSSIYYDSKTVVEFEGRSYRPEDLERGDEITVKGSNIEGRYLAERINVVRDVSR